MGCFLEHDPLRCKNLGTCEVTRNRKLACGVKMKGS